MDRAQKASTALWVLVTVFVVFPGGVGATAGSGFMAPSVCISPAIFLAVALTPAETLVSIGVQGLRNLTGANNDSS